jgi:hypothetical protein
VRNHLYNSCLKLLQCGIHRTFSLAQLLQSRIHQTFSLAQAFTPGKENGQQLFPFPFSPLKGAEEKRGKWMVSPSPGVNAWARKKVQIPNIFNGQRFHPISKVGWSLVLAWMILAVLPVTIHAAESFDPAARAKFIAPFIHEQTLAVVRVDLTRFQIGQILKTLDALHLDPIGELAEAGKKIEKSQRAMVQAGAKDIYLVFDYVLGREPMYGIIPLTPGSDENRIRAALPGPKSAVQRWDDALTVADHRETLDAARAQKPDPRPELAAAIGAAGDSAVQVLLLPPKYFPRVIEETLPELPPALGGGSSKVVTQGVLWAAAGIDLSQPAIRLVVQSKDAAAAQALQEKLVAVMNLVLYHKNLRQFIPQPAQAVSLLTPKAEGDRLTLTLEDKNVGIQMLLALLIPPLEQAQLGAYRAMSINNLKQLALGMLNYESAKKQFPLPGSLGSAQSLLLSWRVQILPFCGYEGLYKQFHLDEPWDSDHNRKLIDRMPPIYRHPFSQKGLGYTNYVLFVGNGAGFDAASPTKVKDIKDGTVNTIVIVEADDGHAVPWTKPEDLAFDPKDPAKGLGRFFNGRFNAAFFDGSVHTMKKDIPAEMLRRLILRNDRELIDWDAVQ